MRSTYFLFSNNQSNNIFAKALTPISFKHLLSIEKSAEISKSFLETFIQPYLVDEIVCLKPLVDHNFRQIGKSSEMMKFLITTRSNFQSITSINLAHSTGLLEDKNQILNVCKNFIFQPNIIYNKTIQVSNLKPVVNLTIITDESKNTKAETSRNESSAECINDYSFQDVYSGKRIDDIQLIQIDMMRVKYLLKYKRKMNELFSERDWWFELLLNSDKYSSETLLSIQSAGTNIPNFFYDGMNRLNKSHWSPKFLEIYNNENDEICHDQDKVEIQEIGEIKEATLEDILEQERRIGMTEGMSKEKDKLGLRMLVAGLPDQDVSRVTDLPYDRIQQLKNEIIHPSM
jgi:hypothetical protein